MKIRGFIVVLSVAAITIFANSCRKEHCIIGNHNYVTESRSLSSFHRISSEGVFNVKIIIDTVEEITIDAEENLLPYIETKVHGSLLVIKTLDYRCIKEHRPITITVRAKNIDDLKLLGSGQIYCDSLSANIADISLAGSGDIYAGVWSSFSEIDISGSGKITLWGETSEGDFNISGSGDIRSYDFEQDTCFAAISGSGSMYVFVKDYLNSKITGSGSVHYKGNPYVKSQITGSGSVIHN